MEISLTYIIIGITVLISWVAFNKPEVADRLILNPYRVSAANEYYRFITSGFIHAHWGHLLLNMLSFYFFGSIVEIYFGYIWGDAGSYYFIALYLLAIIISDVPSYFKQRHNPQYNSLGASGGVAAIIFASIIFNPLQGICLYFILCLPGFILGSGYLVYSYFAGRKKNDNINHEAHLYGALFGFLFCAVLYPDSIPRFIQQIAEWRLEDYF